MPLPPSRSVGVGGSAREEGGGGGAGPQGTDRGEPRGRGRGPRRRPPRTYRPPPGLTGGAHPVGAGRRKQGLATAPPLSSSQGDTRRRKTPRARAPHAEAHTSAGSCECSKRAANERRWLARSRSCDVTGPRFPRRGSFSGRLRHLPLPGAAELRTRDARSDQGAGHASVPRRRECPLEARAGVGVSSSPSPIKKAGVAVAWCRGQHLDREEAAGPCKSAAAGSPPPTAGAAQMCRMLQECTRDWFLLQHLVVVVENWVVWELVWQQVQEEWELAWQDEDIARWRHRIECSRWIGPSWRPWSSAMWSCSSVMGQPGSLGVACFPTTDHHLGLGGRPSLPPTCRSPSHSPQTLDPQGNCPWPGC
ncbi:uncharacterized protein LOC132248269 [Alligator mississippiensis]|uniref:uncharacterized protein LOC132248269 n=1 Tax=Alligator mississippiensis TaxID=8496 RepID=UPI0028772EF3|nr:uncharacterized protein LOC132248269 [Alligator mississippiensis]